MQELEYQVNAGDLDNNNNNIETPVTDIKPDEGKRATLAPTLTAPVSTRFMINNHFKSQCWF